MISRLWHGWTTRDDVDAYEELLRSEILPGIHRVAGFKGALVLRLDGKDEVEFVTLTTFDSREAVTQRSRRKNSWVAWLLREPLGQSRRTKEGERGPIPADSHFAYPCRASAEWRGFFAFCTRHSGAEWKGSRALG